MTNMLAAANTELARLRASWKDEVKGGVRAWDAEYGVAELRERAAHAERSVKPARWKRNTAEKAVTDLTNELAHVTDSKAALACELTDLKNKTAKMEVTHRYELRAHNRDLRRLAAANRGKDAAAAADALQEAATRWEGEAAAAEVRWEAEIQRSEEAIALARRVAEVAREEALQLSEDLAGAEQEKDSTAMLLFLAEKRETRAKAKVATLTAKITDVAPPTRERTADEWAALSRDAKYKAHQREQKRFDSFLSSHAHCPEDLATVLSKHGLLEKLFDTHAGFDIYYDRVKALMLKLEHEDYGVSFALFLRFELKLTLSKILEVTKAGCKEYNRKLDRYKAKVILYHRHRKNVFLKVPRLAPPASKLIPIIESVEKSLGCEHSSDGSIAFRPVAIVFQDLLARDPGTHGMPPLPFYLGGAHPVPIVVQWDATGFGKLQLTTAAVRNPFLPMSAQQLRVLGIGNCGDGKSGTKALMGPNIDTINSWISSDRLVEVDIDDTPQEFKPGVYISTDVSALRHTEHLANSGWCCCGRDFALRTTPKKPETYAEMHALLEQCKSPTATERFDLAHEPRPGETVPRPCPACNFGHGTEAETLELYAELLAMDAKLSALLTKAGKAAYSKWRMAHAAMHHNVQPGEYGRPLLHYDLNDFILDLLHLAELGVPKTPWKHGILNNASDDARQMISDKLAEWKHPLDCRRKDDNRSRADKWFTGEAWASFCAGERGSPGGPQAIAELVMIIADDMQQRGVTIGGGTADEEKAAEAAVLAAPAAPAPAKPKGKAGAAARNAVHLGKLEAPISGSTALARAKLAQLAQLRHVPTAMQLAADEDDLKVIRDVYGSRSQTIINTLLSFDAYFKWYYPLKHHSLGVLDSDKDAVLARAYENCRTAIDMHEICERLSIRNHKSFLFHGAIFKVTRDILKVANTWAFGTSSLELANADTKRVASQAASRRPTFCDYKQTRVPLAPILVWADAAHRHGQEGHDDGHLHPQLPPYSRRTSARRWAGVHPRRECRPAERLFGQGSAGRMSLASAGVKLETLAGPGYDACGDTCIKAFVRRMAAAATAP